MQILFVLGIRHESHRKLKHRVSSVCSQKFRSHNWKSNSVEVYLGLLEIIKVILFVKFKIAYKDNNTIFSIMYVLNFAGYDKSTILPT